jgi:hypothetical protein
MQTDPSTMAKQLTATTAETHIGAETRRHFPRDGEIDPSQALSRIVIKIIAKMGGSSQTPSSRVSHNAP